MLNYKIYWCIFILISSVYSCNVQYLYFFFQPEANVYKLTGPVLVKQDLDEAKSTVKKRIEYISAELKRQESSIEDFQKQQEKHKLKLEDLQRKLASSDKSLKSMPGAQVKA